MIPMGGLGYLSDIYNHMLNLKRVLCGYLKVFMIDWMTFFLFFPNHEIISRSDETKVSLRKEKWTSR